MAEIPYDIEAELAEDAESIKEKQDHRDNPANSLGFCVLEGIFEGWKIRRITKRRKSRVQTF